MQHKTPENFVYSYGFVIYILAAWHYVVQCDGVLFRVCPSKDIGIRAALHLGKTLGNSVVYSCRMPMLKKALNRLLKRRQENIELLQF